MQRHLVRFEACVMGSGDSCVRSCHRSPMWREDHVRVQETGDSLRAVRVLIHRGIVGRRKPGIHAFTLGDTFEARHTYAFWEKAGPSQAKRRAQVGGKLWGLRGFVLDSLTAT